MSSTVPVKLARTFTKFANNIEVFAVAQADALIRAKAKELGADRVRVNKCLTNSTRPVSIHFYNKSKFIRNLSLNKILAE